MSRWIAPVFVTVLTSCSSGPPAPAVEPPAAPAADDPAFSVEGVERWYLIGDPITPGEDELRVRVRAPEDVGYIDLWVADRPGVRLLEGEEQFGLDVDISDLGPGEHEILLAADGSDTAFARLTFYRSHPLYVVMTNDWDDPNNSDLSLSLQEQLHEEHPALVMTHFVGPYTFTDPGVDQVRADYLVDWVRGMRETHGDEIGLHIHPYCNFVETTSVECRSEPSTVYESGDETGYTVMLSAYTEEELTELFLAADDLFEQNGLGKPTSFRAGGWTADLSVLRALANAGYVADTSANNWSRLEEWEGVQNGVLYEWNMTQWASIDDTSQPYYPSEEDILTPGPPSIPVLEIPDNGILVDYVTADEMIEIFQKNWPGGALEEPTAFSIGYHPSNFDQTYFHRLDDTLDHVDQYLASKDQGPVVYGLMSDMPEVWPLSE